MNGSMAGTELQGYSRFSLGTGNFMAPLCFHQEETREDTQVLTARTFASGFEPCPLALHPGSGSCEASLHVCTVSTLRLDAILRLEVR